LLDGNGVSGSDVAFRAEKCSIMTPPIQDASEKERMDNEDRPETKIGGWHRLMLLRKKMYQNNENDGKFLKFIIENGTNKKRTTNSIRQEW